MAAIDGPISIKRLKSDQSLSTIHTLDITFEFFTLQKS